MFKPITIHTHEDYAGMHKAGRLSAEILDELYDFIQIGTSTNEINDYCHKRIIETGSQIN